MQKFEYLLLMVSPSSATASSTSPSATTTASIASAPATTATPAEPDKFRQLGVDNLLCLGQDGD